MRDLLEEYGKTVDGLLAREGELRLLLKSARGEEAFALERRIVCLEAEIIEARDVMRDITRYLA